MPKDTGLLSSCFPNSNKIAWSTIIQQNKYYFFSFSIFFNPSRLPAAPPQEPGSDPTDGKRGFQVAQVRGVTVSGILEITLLLRDTSGSAVQLQRVSKHFTRRAESCSYFTGDAGTSEALKVNLYLQKLPPRAVPITLHHCLLQSAPGNVWGI